MREAADRMMRKTATALYDELDERTSIKALLGLHSGSIQALFRLHEGVCCD